MIDNIFGLSIRYEPWDKKSILPLYIVSNYQFFTAYIENIRCIVIIPIDTSITQKTNTKNSSN